MIRWFVIRLFLALLVVSAALGGYFYFASPSADIRRVFAEYQAAAIAHDAGRVVDLTVPELIDFYDAQRKHALTTSRAELAALPFRERWAVFTLKALVFHGAIKIGDMQRLEGRDFFQAAGFQLPPSGQIVAQMRLIAVIPFGPDRARGYLDPSGQLPGGWLEILMVPVFNDIRFDFVRTESGWLVDPSPLLISSAAENEDLAKYVDPTGNDYLFSTFGIKDAVGQEPYWRPLAPAGQSMRTTNVIAPNFI
jgi:hypothetical protein